MDKPVIVFYEPFEIVLEINGKMLSYLNETQITENRLLEKYSIDYDSFLTNDIRDENGYPEILKSKSDIHKFILDYINN